MHSKKLFVTSCISCLALLFCFAFPAAAEEPTMADAAAAAAAAATPGPHHEHLGVAVGSWDYTMKIWTDPSQPPMESKGTVEAESILGGRYVKSIYKGEMMGMPFEGHGIDGYNNVTGEHVGSWVDNMSTGTMNFTGDCSDDHKTVTMTASFIDPMSKQPMTHKGVTVHTDDDNYVYSAYMVLPDGTEMKGMELTATRRK